MGSVDERDTVVAALVLLAELNVPPDVQELLVYGDVRSEVAPSALGKVLAAITSHAERRGYNRAIEDAAKVAEDRGTIIHAREDDGIDRFDAAMILAAAIRALVKEG